MSDRNLLGQRRRVQPLTREEVATVRAEIERARFEGYSGVEVFFLSGGKLRIKTVKYGDPVKIKDEG